MIPALPSGLRRVCIVALVLSGLVGFRAAQDMVLVVEPPDVSALSHRGDTTDWVAGNPEQREALEAAMRAMLASLEAWAGLRGVTLLLLSLASGLLFVSSVRMFQPAGISREAVRRMMVFSAMACVILRTIDGAQLSAASQAAGLAFVKALEKAQPSAAELADIVPVLWSGAMAVVTLIVAGAFGLTWRYLRSDAVRAFTEGGSYS